MDSISLRPPQRATPEPKQSPEEIEQEESRRKAEKQRAFAMRTGRGVTTGSPANQNNMRQVNLSGLGRPGREPSTPPADFTFMYGMAAVWDIVTFLVALIPVAGWALNLVIFFPVGLFNMYIMAQSRGKSTMQFWGAFKYIVIEAVPYLNIVPAFFRCVYLLENEGKTTGLAGAVNTLNKVPGK